jgi:hypothetical protein
MTTFSDWSTLPVNVKASLDALEQFVGDVDGKEIDDGTVDADDTVKAVNTLAAEIARLRARPTEEEVARAICQSDHGPGVPTCVMDDHPERPPCTDKNCRRFEQARAVIAKFPKVQP